MYVKQVIFLIKLKKMSIRPPSGIVKPYLECSICLETMKEPSILNCGHSFHYECITEWFGLSAEKIVDFKGDLSQTSFFKCPLCNEGTFISAGKKRTKKTTTCCCVVQ